MSESLDPVQAAARAQFDKQSARYGRTHILADTSDIVRALDGIQAPPGAVLDLATGGGHTAVFFAKQGREVTAADISPTMLDNARRLAHEAGVDLRTAEHPSENLPYPDASFAIVSCRVAAHHFSNQPRFVAEAARVLQPAGIFLLIDGTVPEDQPEAERWAHEVEKLRDPSHVRLLPPSRWKALCAGQGLTILRCFDFPFQQPDLEWYFETANTPQENRARVRALVQNPPVAAREAFRIAEESGRLTWWWMRLLLVAQKPREGRLAGQAIAAA